MVELILEIVTIGGAATSNFVTTGYRAERRYLESVEHGPLLATVEENGVIRTKKYAELSVAEKIQADYDMKPTNIILQGLPVDIYLLLNHHRVAKDLWERVQLLMQGEKAMLAEAQEVRQILDEEQLAFLADLGILVGQAQRIIPHNAAFQTKDLDTYDSDCDDLSTAQEEKANKEQNNETIITELERYKERVKTFEQHLNIDLSSHEKMIDSQMDDMIREKLALKEQVDSLEQNLSKQIKEKESVLQTFVVFKNESKEKENKYMENEIDLEKKIKELDNIICKVGQSAQTVHMLTKPQAFYDNTHKQALGYQNPFYLKKAQRIKPTLYDGVVMSNAHVAMPVIDDEETLILEEESRSKMSKKAKDPEVIAKKISHKPIDYEKLNRLTKDFEKVFFSTIKNYHELPKVTLVNVSLKKFKFHLTQFDLVVKKRTTSNALEEAQIQDKVSFAPRSKPPSNKKNDRISQTPSRNKKNKVEAQPRKVNKTNRVVKPVCDVDVKHSLSNVNYEMLCATCNKSTVDGVHDKCCQILYDLGTNKIARIMGYGDYQLGNVVISRVYYVEGLGHNLFSVGQFCDADLEVSFWKNTCFIRNLEGVDLLSGSRDTNLYTISLDDMLKSSPIFRLSKASKTKSYSGPGLQYMTPATYSTRLVSKPVSQQPCIPPNRNDWDHLFQPMFDEYYNPPTIAVSPVQEAAAPRAEVLADSLVSISINRMLHQQVFPHHKNKNIL
ncbi:hypothetical protein Tco_0014304 [Tanacetum coccineum]